MTEYKAGDRVEYVGPSPFRTGKHYTITGITGIAGEYAEVDEDKFFTPKLANIRHATAPDVITIDRAELPEVVADGDTLECGSVIYGCTKSNYYRSNAMHYLAIAEFLEAREKLAAEDAAAAKLAAAKLAGRRDKLANKFIDGPITYEYTIPAVQRAIDAYIALEDAHGA